MIGAPWLYARDALKADHKSSVDSYDFELKRVDGPDGDRRFVVDVILAKSGGLVGQFTLKLGELTTLQPPTGDPQADERAQGWRVSVAQRVPVQVPRLVFTKYPPEPWLRIGGGMVLLGLLLAGLFPRDEVWFWVDRKGRRLHVVAAYRRPRAALDRAARSAAEACAAPAVASNLKLET
jgi:hypothetical protein